MLVFTSPVMLLAVVSCLFPVFLHLAHGTRTPEAFPSLALARPSEPAKSFLRIRDPLLLFIRMILLAFLAAVLGGPFFSHRFWAPLKKADARCLIVIDNSLSMSRKDRHGDELLHLAQRTANKILARRGARAQVAAVALFGDERQTAFSDDFAAVSEDIARIGYFTGTGRSAALARIDGKPTVAYLVTDGYLSAAAGLRGLLQCPVNVVLLTSPAPGNPIVRVGVSDEPGGSAFRFVLTTSTPGARIGLFEDGRRLGGAETGSDTTCEFRVDYEGRGVRRFSFVADGADVEDVGAYRVCVSDPPRLKVAALGDGQKIFTALFSAMDGVLKLDDRTLAGGAEIPRDVELLFVSGGPGRERAEDVYRFVAAGGKAIFFPSDDPFSTALMTALELDRPTTGHDAPRTVAVRDDFFGSGFMLLDLRPGAVCDLAGSAPPRHLRVTLDGDDNLFLAEKTVGQGRLFVLGAGITDEKSNLATRNNFLPLVATVVRHAFPQRYLARGESAAGRERPGFFLRGDGTAAVNAPFAERAAGPTAVGGKNFDMTVEYARLDGPAYYDRDLAGWLLIALCALFAAEFFLSARIGRRTRLAVVARLVCGGAGIIAGAIFLLARARPSENTAYPPLNIVVDDSRSMTLDGKGTQALDFVEKIAAQVSSECRVYALSAPGKAVGRIVFDRPATDLGLLPAHLAVDNGAYWAAVTDGIHNAGRSLDLQGLRPGAAGGMVVVGVGDGAYRPPPGLEILSAVQVVRVGRPARVTAMLVNADGVFPVRLLRDGEPVDGVSADVAASGRTVFSLSYVPAVPGAARYAITAGGFTGEYCQYVLGDTPRTALIYESGPSEETKFIKRAIRASGKLGYSVKRPGEMVDPTEIAAVVVGGLNVVDAAWDGFDEVARGRPVLFTFASARSGADGRGFANFGRYPFAHVTGDDGGLGGKFARAVFRPGVATVAFADRDDIALLEGARALAIFSEASLAKVRLSEEDRASYRALLDGAVGFLESGAAGAPPPFAAGLEKKTAGAGMRNTLIVWNFTGRPATGICEVTGGGRKFADIDIDALSGVGKILLPALDAGEYALRVVLAAGAEVFEWSDGYRVVEHDAEGSHGGRDAGTLTAIAGVFGAALLDYTDVGAVAADVRKRARTIVGPGRDPAWLLWAALFFILAGMAAAGKGER